MKNVPPEAMNDALRWAESVLGEITVVSDRSREHPGLASSVCRLETGDRGCYLKVHQDAPSWNREVHALEQWSPAVDGFAPELLGAKVETPLALIVDELPGVCAEDAELTAEQEKAVWHTAGKALARLHGSRTGERFGPCLRDGTPVGDVCADAERAVRDRLSERMSVAERGKYVSGEELEILRVALAMTGAFSGKTPVPCHRDYCTANWIVGEDGQWKGAIDFEFSAWDVWVADLSRFAGWEWMLRPELVDALLDGYGRVLSSADKRQILVGHAEYALAMIVWGRDNSYFGSEREGHEALAHLASLLRDATA